MDAVTLSRVQFGLTAAFHYIYPPMSIGLGVLMVIFELTWLRTGKALYHQLARFWTRIFGLIFAMGVATGIVMEFEFGTNWATYSRFVGDVFGSPLAAEAIFAFFLESSFLGLLIFGWDRVSRGVHFLATCMVCLGAHLSAVWILVANSWMHTPAGFHIVGEGPKARAEITDFWAMVFNPSTVDRVLHTICGAWQTGAFLVISVGAWYLLRSKHTDFARASLRTALPIALGASLLQLVTGHVSAQGVAKNQPVKLAAFEGLYDTTSNAPLKLFGWVDEENEISIGPAIPGLLSFLAHNDASKPVLGLREVAPAQKDRPPVNVTFQFFHLMVAVGFGLIALSALGLYSFWRGSLERKKWVLWLLVLAAIGPHVANQAGWFAAEVGRQPWIVQGLLRTSDAVSQTLKPGAVLGSIILFSLVYLVMFALFLYVLFDKIRHGPDEADLIVTGRLAHK